MCNEIAMVTVSSIMIQVIIHALMFTVTHMCSGEYICYWTFNGIWL